MRRKREKRRPSFIHARRLLVDGTKPTDPLEEKPVRLISISIFLRIVYGWRDVDFSFFGNSNAALFSDAHRQA